jgi:hypothetical protein
MGSWSTSIEGDDTVLDVLGYISDKLKFGKSLEEAIREAKLAFAEIITDEDETPVFWLAIASAQWKFQGFVEPSILTQIQYDIKNECGLDRWNEDPKALIKRKEVLVKFLNQIEQSNPKPSKPPKLIIRVAPYQAGDCLSVRLKDGKYTALLVLKADNSKPEYGKNLIGQLDYLSDIPPCIEVFKKKNWLILNQGIWKNRKHTCWYLPVGYQKVQDQIHLVGNIRLGLFLPKDDGLHGGWSGVGETIGKIYENRVK